MNRRRVVEGKADDKEDVCASDAVLDCDNYTMRRKETCKLLKGDILSNYASS